MFWASDRGGIFLHKTHLIIWNMGFSWQHANLHIVDMAGGHVDLNQGLHIRGVGFFVKILLIAKILPSSGSLRIPDASGLYDIPCAALWMSLVNIDFMEGWYLAQKITDTFVSG